MKNQEKASISIMKIICISIILILISGIGVMAVNTGLNDVKIILQNGYEMTVLTSKTKVSEILEENNVLIEENQKVIPDLNSEISSGESIKITDKSYNEVQIAKVSKEGAQTTLEQLLENYSPITEKIIVERVEIPYETITKNTTGATSNITNKVIQEGKNGVKEITYKVKYQNEVEIEKTIISEVVVEEPVNKIVQAQKIETSRASTVSRTESSSGTSAVSYGGGKWSYSESDIDLLCAITAQESSSSYTGALAVITCACNRAESSAWAGNGSDPLSQYKARGQFCYSIDNYWRKRLNGNYASFVKQAVLDALDGKRNHDYLSFRAAGTHSGQLIGGNVYF